jgi:peroxin-1
MALCDFPSRDERVDILHKMSANLKLERDVNFEEIADRTENYSPADLQAIVNDAQLAAVHLVLEAEKGAMLEAGADAEAPEVRPLHYQSLPHTAG